MRMRRCEVSGGAGAEYPVVGAGVWHVDDASKVLARLDHQQTWDLVAAAHALSVPTPLEPHERGVLPATMTPQGGTLPVGLCFSSCSAT